MEASQGFGKATKADGACGFRPLSRPKVPVLSQLQSNIKTAPCLLEVGQRGALRRSPRTFSLLPAGAECSLGIRVLPMEQPGPEAPPSLTRCSPSALAPVLARPWQFFLHQGQFRKGTLGMSPRQGPSVNDVRGEQTALTKEKLAPCLSSRLPAGADLL